MIDRLLVKWETARSMLPKPEVRYHKANKLGLLTVGSGDSACVEALVVLEQEGIGMNLLPRKSVSVRRRSR